jgi:hypothetical protein
MATYAVINQSNIVTSLVWWDGEGVWLPDRDIDDTPQTVVSDTDPSTAQIGMIYNPVDGTFSSPAWFPDADVDETPQTIGMLIYNPVDGTFTSP